MQYNKGFLTMFNTVLKEVCLRPIKGITVLNHFWPMAQVADHRIEKFHIMQGI